MTDGNKGSPMTLVWFRRDLRLQDNPALVDALAKGPVQAVYIHAPEDEGAWPIGQAARWYLHHSLLALQRQLAAIDVPLHVLSGSAENALIERARELGVHRVACNRVMEPGLLARDERIKARLATQAVAMEVFHDDTLLSPERVHKHDGTPYRVFTPFWRCVEGVIEREGLQLALTPAPTGSGRGLAHDRSQVEALRLLGAHHWHRKLHDHWSPGEIQALERLYAFGQNHIADYEQRRNLPAQSGTSVLSPALHFGEVSVARVYACCRQWLAQEQRVEARNGIKGFMAEIGWREFGRHLLHAFPETPDRSLNPRFEQPGAWLVDGDGDLLRRWQRGETGYPLVDAGMRQLWQTGWMHNRVRMVTASFLCKNLGIHWRMGARWFWDALVDADLASNTLGWQWVAGCGADAAPYYRIFNPQLQAQRFDPDRAYIRRWLDDEHAWPSMVDLKTSRAEALARYQNSIRSAS
jgi:deoxyribodipyrimidine photo-lyase